MTDSMENKKSGDGAFHQIRKNIEPKKSVTAELAEQGLASEETWEQYRKRVIREWADIPPEPAISKEAAEIELNALNHQRIYNETMRYNMRVKPEETKALFTKCEDVIKAHNKREANINRDVRHVQFPLTSIFVEKFCELSKSLIVVDTTGDMLDRHQELLQNFVDEGRALTVFSTKEKNHFVHEKGDVASVLLSSEQVERLYQSNIRNAIVGDAHEGCFFWEKTTTDHYMIARAGPGFKQGFGVMMENLGNVFRSRKKHERRDAYQAAKDAVPNYYETLISFCHNEMTNKLAQNIEIAINGPQV